MGQDRKKQKKQLDSKRKERQFSNKYANYTPQKKSVVNQPQVDVEEPAAEEVISVGNTDDTGAVEFQVNEQINSAEQTTVEAQPQQELSGEASFLEEQIEKIEKIEEIEEENEKNQVKNEAEQTNIAPGENNVSSENNKPNENSAEKKETGEDARRQEFLDLMSKNNPENVIGNLKSQSSGHAIPGKQSVSKEKPKTEDKNSTDVNKEESKPVEQTSSVPQPPTEKMLVFEDHVPDLDENGDLKVSEEDQKLRNERMERHKNELRDAERNLASLMNLPETKSEYEITSRQQQKDYLEKRIKTLQSIVPEADRLPIDDEKPALNEDLPKEEDPKEEGSKEEQIKEEVPQQPIESNPNPVPDQERDMIDGAKLHSNIALFTNISALKSRLNSNISDILKAAEVGEDKVNSIEIDEILADAYTLEKVPNASIPMRDVTKHVFMSTYAAMDKKGVTPKNKIETAQKIADVLLKNYSPVTYTVEKLNKYADNYVVNDKELLKECLTGLNLPENEIKAAVGDNEEKKAEQKETVNDSKETKPVNSEARVAVYTEKLKAYNNMYKLSVDSDRFAASVTDAWDLMTSGDKEKMAKGQTALNEVFKDTLKKAFDVEKGVAYEEHRLPEYAEIIKSTNELMRSAMYGFTDMYHNAKRTDLFETTAFGGLNAKDMAALTEGQSLWSMDQKSNEAWDIQSKEAKNLAEKWLKEDRPHEKMIAEMRELVNANKEGVISRKEMLDKLTAAEWLLENDKKMMIEDPEDPYNTIPNWGNRYWKTLIETREELGIDKHTSMRDMIQADYAASAKAVNNRNYNEAQINYYVLDKDVRELVDSMDVQKEQFAIQSAAVNLTKPQENKELDDDMTETRKRHPVTSLDQRNIMRNEPKNENWILVPDTQKELTILGQANSK